MSCALDHAGIARRIPHQGAMCLLERVRSWDAELICCEAGSHRSAANPLRAQGSLGIACGIEYAAQAMAVHGALIGESQGEAGAPPRAGYLVSLRGVTLHAPRLDDVQGDLEITARRLLGDANSIVYGFEVAGNGRTLLEGRATVMLDAAGLA